MITINESSIFCLLSFILQLIPARTLLICLRYFIIISFDISSSQLSQTFREIILVEIILSQPSSPTTLHPLHDVYRGYSIITTKPCLTTSCATRLRCKERGIDIELGIIMFMSVHPSSSSIFYPTANDIAMRIY